jgi:hypothetical protein
LRENRNSRFRGRSSPLEVAIEKKTTGGLLPLELVDSADPCVRAEPLSQASHLCAVGRHDEHVVPTEAALAAVAFGVHAADQLLELGGDPVGLLDR